MLEDLNYEEKIEKINEIRQGWTAVQRMIKREHPGTRLSARYLYIICFFLLRDVHCTVYIIEIRGVYCLFSNVPIHIFSILL